MDNCITFSQLDEQELLEVDGGSTKVVGAIARGVAILSGAGAGAAVAGYLGYGDVAAGLAGVGAIAATVSTVCTTLPML